MAAALWFRSVDGALRTIAACEAMNVIRMGQIQWRQKSSVRCITSSGSSDSCVAPAPWKPNHPRTNSICDRSKVPAHRWPLSPADPQQRWLTFVCNHAQVVVACDFFVVVTTTFRTLYVLVIMELGSMSVISGSS